MLFDFSFQAFFSKMLIPRVVSRFLFLRKDSHTWVLTNLFPNRLHICAHAEWLQNPALKQRMPHVERYQITILSERLLIIFLQFDCKSTLLTTSSAKHKLSARCVLFDNLDGTPSQVAHARLRSIDFRSDWHLSLRAHGKSLSRNFRQ